MERINLRMNENMKYEIIKEFVDHGGNKNRVAIKLNLSIRQVNRLIKKYKETGKAAFIHGNRSKKPLNTLQPSISKDIIQFYQTKYHGFNFSHFREYLIEYEGINVSYNCIYHTLMNAGFVSPKVRRLTRKKIKRLELEKLKLLENKSNDEITQIINHEIAIEDSHPRKEKPKNFGEVIEQDGSIHPWFGDKKACLHLAVDKATNTIVGAYFDWQETLNGYYQVLKQILISYGIPYKFFTDNRTVFNYTSLNPDKRTSDKDVLTQYGYACKQLGTLIETSSVSQAKGLIERDNSTFQDRLVNELRLNGIQTIDDANEYLINVFIPKFNKKFALDYTKFTSVFENAPDTNKLNYILAVLTPRKIDNGNAIKYKNKYYQPYLDNQLKCFKPKTECLVIRAFNNDLLVSIDENIYELRELNRNATYSENFDVEPSTPAFTSNKYKPSPNHPWRVKTFLDHQKKAHDYHSYT